MNFNLVFDEREAEMALKNGRDDLANRKLYRVSDACELLNCSRNFFYKQVRAGRIGIIKLGNTIRISKTELERILAEGAE